MGGGASTSRSERDGGGGRVSPGTALRGKDDAHGHLICRFCGGKSCKHERWELQEGPSAVRGLNSTWITRDLMGCQRPSTRLMNEYGIVKQFLDMGVGAVICLQQRGEHPLCGDGIDVNSGLSYEPEQFMASGIAFFWHEIADFGVPPLSQMLQIVQIVSYSIYSKRSRVMIHCHAGFGRTGIVAACWLVYSFQMSALDAVETVRQRRPGSVQTDRQRSFVFAFEDYVKALRRVYVLPPIVRDDETFSLVEFLARQRQYLHGEEGRKRKLVPKIVSVLCDVLGRRAAADPLRVSMAFVDVGPRWGVVEEEDLRRLKTRINNDDWYGLPDINVRYQAQLLLDWLDTLTEPLIPTEVTRRALEQPESVAVDDFDATPAAHLATLEAILTMLKACERHRDEDVADRVRVRFAYALMHPLVPLPEPRPFRTLRITVLPDEERLGVGLVHMGDYHNTFELDKNAGDEHKAKTKKKKTTKPPRPKALDEINNRRSGPQKRKMSLLSVRTPRKVPHSPGVAPPGVGKRKPVQFSFPPIDSAPPASSRRPRSMSLTDSHDDLTASDGLATFRSSGGFSINAAMAAADDGMATARSNISYITVTGPGGEDEKVALTPQEQRQQEQQRACLQSLILLGNYVALLVENWDEFSSRPTTTTGGVGGMQPGDTPVGFERVAAERERNEQLDRFRDRSTPRRDTVSFEDDDWGRDVSQRTSETFVMLPVNRQIELLDTLLTRFADQPHVRDSVHLSQQGRSFRNRFRQQVPHQPLSMPAVTKQSSVPTLPNLPLSSIRPARYDSMDDEWEVASGRVPAHSTAAAGAPAGQDTARQWSTRGEHDLGLGDEEEEEEEDEEDDGMADAARTHRSVLEQEPEQEEDQEPPEEKQDEEEEQEEDDKD